MRVTFGHVADYAMVSREGKLSVIGIFSQLNAPKFPYVHPQLFLAFEVELDYRDLNRDCALRVDLVDQDGDTLFRAEATLHAKAKAKPGVTQRAGHVLNINNLRFKRAGRHEVNIFLDGRPEHPIPFEVQGPGGPAAKQEG